METTNYNRIFQYAFTGVLLLIGAMAFILSNISTIASDPIYMLTAGIAGGASLSLIGVAVKKDSERLKEL